MRTHRTSRRIAALYVTCILLLAIGALLVDAESINGVDLCPIRYAQLQLPSSDYLPASILTSDAVADDTIWNRVTATQSNVMPTVVVLVTDSFGNVEADVTPERMSVRAVGVSVASGSEDTENPIFLDGNVVPVTAGRAIFRNLRVNLGTTATFKL